MSHSKNQGPALCSRRRASGRVMCHAVFNGTFLSFGAKDDPETQKRFARAKCAWELAGRELTDAVRAAADGRTAPEPASRAPITLAELIAAFVAWAKEHYRDAAGKVSREVYNVELACKPLKDDMGAVYATDFGPKLLTKYQRDLVEKGSSRKTINQRCGVLRRVFRWGAKNELLPASVWHELQTVDGLQRGRSGAKEGREVLPAPRADVESTLPHLPRMVRAMVELQLATGMRPSEVRRFRLDETDMTGEVWLFRPSEHKNSWRGRDRVVSIGPKGQAAIRSVLRPGAQTGFLFDPRVAEAERWAAQRKARVTPFWSGHVAVKARQMAARERRPIGDHYSRLGYPQAVRRACKAAKVPVWTPGQLRHTFATEVRKEFGLDTARTLLGHARVETTQIYAQADTAKAIDAAQRIG